MGKTILTWTIENYSKLALKNGLCIHIPMIAIDDGKQNWKLDVYPNGLFVKSKLFCTLQETSKVEFTKETSNVEIEGDCTFQLISPKGKVCFPVTKKLDQSTFGTTYAVCIQYLQNEMTEWKEDVLTVQCVMNIKYPKLCPASELKAVSEVGLGQNTFAWCFKAPDSTMRMQRKVFSIIDKSSFEVTLTTGKDEIFIDMQKTSKVNIGCQSFRRKISLIDKNNIEIFSTKDTFIISSTSDKRSWTLPSNFKYKIFEENNPMVSGYFIVILEFLDISEEPEKPFTDLQCDLKQMLLDKKHSDVNLKADGQLFSAHKCLLSSRSPVFRTMFDSEMLETQTNAVDIDDLDATTLESLLKFLYTGIIDACNCENALKLLLAADKYQVQSLTEKCAKNLMDLLSQENLLDVIEIADLVKHEDLKASALHLLKEHASDILSSTEWLEWSKQNIQLAFEISSKMALQYSLEQKRNNKK